MRLKGFKNPPYHRRRFRAGKGKAERFLPTRFLKNPACRAGKGRFHVQPQQTETSQQAIAF